MFILIYVYKHDNSHFEGIVTKFEHKHFFEFAKTKFVKNRIFNASMTKHLNLSLFSNAEFIDFIISY